MWPWENQEVGPGGTTLGWLTFEAWC
ncbi:rCG47104 [Rattus norvegicus]|uniref:RCG47104 n=1 Tax=Rattus norvegicus TaxID=10116 RepID=A6KQF3_RAT|nr:rCG47104 [Rattus norvegicus]